MGTKKISPIYYFAVASMALLFFVFHTIPFLQGIFYSFTDWKGYGNWEWVGIRNYLQLFKDPDVLGAYAFTFTFAIITTILVNILSLTLACALNAKIAFSGFLKAVYFLPYMLGNLMIGFIFNFIFAHIVPQIGQFLGIEALSVNILGTDKAMWGIIFVTVWSCSAFNTLIYTAGLKSISDDIYEAAAIDGASGIKRFTGITFPLLATSFTINVIY